MQRKSKVILRTFIGKSIVLLTLYIGLASCLTPPATLKEATVPIAPISARNVENVKRKEPGTELTPDPVKTLLVLATLDGSLTAVDRISGDVRWVSKDEPMIKVPSSPGSSGGKAPYFLPDPKTGSLYVMGRKNSLRKMPFTIPQLVSMAPCKNSEGMMYTGRKLDYWLRLNPHTGEKSEVPMHGDSCPAKETETEEESCTFAEALQGKPKRSIVIGKTEYTLSMKDGPRKWNVTYHTYASMDLAQSSQYDLVHFTSPSTGTVMTYDRESGQLLWQRELDSPVIAVYAVDHTSNLVSIPFNSIAPETLAKLKADTPQDNTLSSTTYIGESNYGLYAFGTLADDSIFLITSEEKDMPPLIEGPDGQGQEGSFEAPLEKEKGQVPNNDSAGNNNNNIPDVIVLGYYNVPEPTGKPPLMQIGSSHDSLPVGQYNDSHLDAPELEDANNIPHNGNLEMRDPISLTPQPVTNNKIPFPPFSFPHGQPVTPVEGLSEKVREIKPIKIVFTTAAISVVCTLVTMISSVLVYRKYFRNPPATIVPTPRKPEDKKKVSDSEEDSAAIKKSKKAADGTLSIGKISFHPNTILGKGCEGTFVYKGKFEGRDVAVKRILPECFAFADREVDLLKESDQHSSVIRYFCTESDGQFRYIALELCEATLSDWVEGKFKCENLDPIQVLRDATDGLSHLHSLRIVHRDIKPANVLLSVNGNGSRGVRTMISDFGLCKKITNGRMSFSRRSGGIPGTDGWIAPEVLKNMDNLGSPTPSNRMSYSVDVFSLGCVYYYVLTNGDHPFGEPFRRQSNIVNGEYNLEKLTSNSQGVCELINLMISSDASSRPPLSDVLTHPIFWNKDKILAFFLDVSDRIEKEDENKCPLLRRLESDGRRIVRDDWRNLICSEVAMDLRKYRTYKGESVRDLLRALRNKKNHYRELTAEAQASLGDIPDQFTEYWISRFPELLSYTWLKFELIRHEPVFIKYYPKEFSFNAIINGDDNDMFDEELEDTFDSDGNRLNVKSESPDKSPKIDKNFWRSKSQFKYQKWRRQQQHSSVKENPHNFTSFGTTRYPQPHNDLKAPIPDSDKSWRNPVAKDK